MVPCLLRAYNNYYTKIKSIVPRPTETKLGQSQNQQTVFQLSIGGLICQAAVMVTQRYVFILHFRFHFRNNLQSHTFQQRRTVFLNMLKMADDQLFAQLKR